MYLKHFSHSHPLAYQKSPPPSAETVICSGCNLHILSDCPTYLCWECQFFLHDHCVRAARFLSHPSHSSHPLALLPYPTYTSGYFVCDLCNKQGTAFSYCCPSCDFDLHIHCALNFNNIKTNDFAPISFPGPNQTQNFGDTNIQYQNSFPPIPTQYTNTQYSITPRQTYENNIPEQSMYTPSRAHYSNIHYMPTPEIVSYPTVSAITHASCHNFDPSVEVAAGGAVPLPQPKGVKHFSHEHLLDLRKVIQRDVTCCGCAEKVSGLTYKCTKSDCTFSLHRECFGLPRELKHKAHAEHPLSLLTAPAYKEGYASCNACLSDISTSFSYHCSTCKFDLHITCAFLHVTMKRNDHPHTLAIIDSLPDYETGDEEHVIVCNICLDIIDVKNSWFYLCKECDFGTHLECVNATKVEKTQEESLAEVLFRLDLEKQGREAILQLWD